VGGLSKDPDKRAKQLANLKRGGNSPEARRGYEAWLADLKERRLIGTSTMPHGGGATSRTLPVSDKAHAIYLVLAEDAPLRDQDGELPRADRMTVELLALCLARLDSVTTYLTMHGPLDLKGNVRPAAEYEVKLRREAAGHADALGMSPRSRARLGLDLTRQSSIEQVRDMQSDMRAAGDRLRARAAAIEAENGVIDAVEEEDPDGGA
jgi:hypothetical protein